MDTLDFSRQNNSRFTYESVDKWRRRVARIEALVADANENMHHTHHKKTDNDFVDRYTLAYEYLRYGMGVIDK